ncbi:hypothetical protein D8S85_08365 [Butyricimonas faecalis]|uniref:Uncharacterized protein n=1 Tax=Butyricimonas faecalis TaxID=2093856 RepID=A0A3Q9IMW4_9BACT|nr:hypothetical protein D8S85_08365 [Butyricimonas faecalis]
MNPVKSKKVDFTGFSTCKILPIFDKKYNFSFVHPPHPLSLRQGKKEVAAKLTEEFERENKRSGHARTRNELKNNCWKIIRYNVRFNA